MEAAASVEGASAGVEGVSAAAAPADDGRKQLKTKNQKLTKGEKEKIVSAIAEAERTTSGEIRVHVSSHCKEDVFGHAKRIFERLHMERTKERNAVLIFVALKARRFAIIGDTGIHEKVREIIWKNALDTMRGFFSKGRIQEGISAGVLSVGTELRKYFPAHPQDKNELSNEITGV